MRSATAFLLALLVGGVVAPEAVAAPLTVAAVSSDVGWIDLKVTGTPGRVVTVTERAGEAVEPVATVTLKGERQTLVHAARWRCDRRRRQFAASSDTGEAATAPVLWTRSCAHRLGVALAPVLPRAGRPVTVRVTDRWRTGEVRARACLTPRRGSRRCRTVSLAAGRRAAGVRLRSTVPGVARVTVQPAWGGFVVRRLVELRRPGRRLRLLATGDSMIQVVDGFLKDRLAPRGVSVASDARIGTGISKPFMLDWVAHARRQAQSRRPDVTVVFIGANDGFGIGGVQCCGPKWVLGYARRVRRMMRSYERGGISRVYWLTLPAPSRPQFARVFRAVNAALRLAAPALGESGRLIDLGTVFTPGGRFRSRYRQADGVHLNVTGARIAARVIAQVLRRDGVTG